MLKRGIRRAKDSVRRTIRGSTSDITFNSALPPEATPTQHPPISSLNAPATNITPAAGPSDPDPPGAARPDQAIPTHIAPSTQNRVGQACFTGPKRLADVLGKASSEFGPLKSAVD
ncbi:hypothetical protein FRC10_005802, partial [Ceratobasidium sp. 414]